MSSNYSDRLKLELMATGANANTWGTNTNNNLDVIDAFSAGYLSKSVAGSANITLSTANASDTAEASNKVIELTGALTGDIVVFIPAVESNYTFFNNTTGSQTLTIAATGHTANGTLITQGAHTTVYCDGSSNFNVEIASSTDAGALNKGTLPDARFPATLPAVSGANLTNLDAADLASGTIPDARFPATLPALNGSALTDLNATNLATGTVANARLDTVPTSKGGTGLTSIGTAGQVLTVNSGASGLEFATASGGGVASVINTDVTSTGNYTADASTQFATFEVIGGGGGGSGSTYYGPGAGSGSSGGTTSLGSLITATGGSGGPGGGGGSGTSNRTAVISKGQSGTGKPGSASNGGAAGGSSAFFGNAGAGGTGGNTGGNLGNRRPGGGGGGAGGVFAVIAGPEYSPSISITIGAGGGGGSGGPGPNGRPGSAGGTGRVRISEFIS
tara:strand:+ start:956 stop:2299 length:1344 start_codon:yes stop_codon:yes gene_type:complete